MSESEGLSSQCRKYLYSYTHVFIGWVIYFFPGSLNQKSDFTLEMIRWMFGTGKFLFISEERVERSGILVKAWEKNILI